MQHALPRILATLVATLTLAVRIHAAEPSVPNTLTAAEKAAGWKLLFDGKTYSGWHNFKKEGVRPGWQIKDGCVPDKQGILTPAVACADQPGAAPEPVKPLSEVIPPPAAL